MQYRILGNSGLRVSVLSYGAWQLGDPSYWGESDAHDADRAVGAALDAGINLFDTAEGYGDGRSEEALGRALGARRDEVLIASKVRPDKCSSEGIRAACERSLQRLGTDVIDLYQIHWPIREHPVDDAAETMGALVAEGKVRAAGVSNFGPQDLEDWLRSGPCTSNQLAYNLLFRAIEHEIVPACAAHNLGILVYMPVMQGILAGRWDNFDDIPMLRRRTRHFRSGREGTMHDEPGAEDLTRAVLEEVKAAAQELGQPMAVVSLAWVIAQPGITSAIIGARKPDQLAANLAAGDYELPTETLERLNAATEPLKERLGPNADMWKSGSESRIR